jgi:hypothetical protein
MADVSKTFGSKNTVEENDDEISSQEKNLKNIARPTMVSDRMQKNLDFMSSDKRRLHDQMMLDGPKGGIQGNVPRGIGM